MDRKEVKFGEAAMSLSADLICLQGGGGAEGEAALAMLEKQLICPICLELFNKPVVILPCQHNLCRKCANELYQPSLFQPRTTMQVNSGRFRCPSCRHEVLLDRHGVYGLPRNLLVENIIDVYKQEVNNSSNNTSPAPPPPPPAQVTCADHEGEKVNIYCVSCQVPTCSLCKVFGAHQSCQVAPLTDVYQQQKDELSEEVGSLVVVNDKIQTLINELEETCRNTEDNCKSQKQSVCEKFNQVFSILQERQKALTQRISSEQEEKTGHIRALVRCYGDSVEANNKLLERAVSSMEEADMAAFVQNSRELIKIVVAASGSRPAETLKPGYESLSRYTCDFSRQERALGGIGFLKVVEHVPEEPEVEQEPEEPPEPPEPSVQNTEPDPHQENSTQELESAGEPVKEPIPAPVEPVQKAAPTSTPVQPDPGLVMDSVEPGGAAPEAEADDVNEGESDEKNTMEEEGCEDVNEENICERQEGMSTQQFEGGEETAGKHDAQEDEEEEEVLKEEMVVMLYPSWYKPRVIPAEILPELHDTEQMMCSPHPAGEEPPLVQTVSQPQIQPQPPWSLDSQTQSVSHPNQPENQPQPLSPHESQSHPQTVPEELGRGFTPGPHMQETAGEEPEEEVDLQGWVCLPGAVGGSFDPLERSRSDNLELSDGRLEEAEEEEQHDEDAPGSELEERGLGDFEAAAMNERLEKGGVWSDEGSKMHEKDLLDGLRRADSFTDGDAEFEALGFTEKEEDGESREQPEDEMETSAAETKGKIASFHFLQALTLLFYLLAFLAILQRFWAYIGCFICT